MPGRHRAARRRCARCRPLTDAPAIGGIVTRSVATLRYVGGDAARDRPLPRRTVPRRSRPPRRLCRARRARARARRLRRSGAIAPPLPTGSPAFRALAITGNNLSAELEEKHRPHAVQTQGMFAAARGGLTFWRIAGTWLEEERALYQLARSLIAAGQPAEAVECAKQCAKVCVAHDAPAFERFFAYAVLARALRDDGRPRDYREMRKEALAWFERCPTRSASGASPTSRSSRTERSAIHAGVGLKSDLHDKPPA